MCFSTCTHKKCRRLCRLTVLPALSATGFVYLLCLFHILKREVLWWGRGTSEDGIDIGVSQACLQAVALCLNGTHFLPCLGVPSLVWHEVTVFPQAAVRLSRGGLCPPALGGTPHAGSSCGRIAPRDDLSLWWCEPEHGGVLVSQVQSWGVSAWPRPTVGIPTCPRMWPHPDMPYSSLSPTPSSSPRPPRTHPCWELDAKSSLPKAPVTGVC